MPKETVLAFDYGQTQIGVAIGNTITKTARPLALISADQGKPDWLSVERLINEWQPSELVVGAPVNQEGEDDSMLLKCQRFARQLEGRFNLDVKMIDEGFSSKEAKSIAKEEGHRGNYKDAPIDHYAAAVFLSDFLARN